MAKVRASLADVKTSRELIPPARFRLKITEIKEKVERADPPNQHMERQNFNFKCSVQDEGEQKGKSIYHNVSMHKKNGEPNSAGMADLKRFFMACLGYDEDDEFFQDDSNLDTDLILNHDFDADVIIEHWKNEAKNTEGDSNRLNVYTMSPVGAGGPTGQYLTTGS